MPRFWDLAKKLEYFKRFLLLFSILLIFPLSLKAQNPYYSKSYALVIAVDKFPSYDWKNLDYAVKDAQGIAAYLEEQGFDVHTLYNKKATRKAILSYMQNHLSRVVAPNDRALIFFSGYGETRQLDGENRGYIIPYDATADSNHISMDTLLAASRMMDTAKHQLFLMAACYSGRLGSSEGGVNPNSSNYLNEVSQRYARQILIAGRKHQRLSGGSYGRTAFTNAILEALIKGQGDYNNDSYITFQELSRYVMTNGAGAKSTPLAGSLPGHGFGEFIFKYVKPEIITPPKPFVDESARQQNTPSGMVYVPGGTFKMGSMKGAEDERPVREVHVAGFYMDRYEVSNAQFCDFLNVLGNQQEGGGRWLDIDDENCKIVRQRGSRYVPKNGYENHPVVEVSWHGATAYATWLGKRLPAEAEWEFAAREGGKNIRFGNGKSTADPAEINFDASESYKAPYSIAGEYRGETAPVNSFEPNGLGLFNMSGNVSEWCTDWYQENYYRKRPGQSAAGPQNGDARVVRGGSWYTSPYNVRTTRRASYKPAGSTREIGFRLAKTP